MMDGANYQIKKKRHKPLGRRGFGSLDHSLRGIKVIYKSISFYAMRRGYKSIVSVQENPSSLLETPT